MITSLDRYILKQILFPASIAFFLIGFMAIAAEIQDSTDNFPRGFLTPVDIGFLVLFLFPSILALLIPIAFFVGILMAFGRLAQQGEITAMQAAGISLKRLTRAILVASVVLSVICYALQDWLQPLGMARAFDIMHNDLPQRLTIDKLDAGELHNYEGWRIHFASKDESTHTLYDFDLIQPEGTGVVLFHADEAQLTRSGDEYTLHLRWGYSISQQNVHVRFDGLDKPFPLPAVLSSSKNHRSLANLSTMMNLESDLSMDYAQNSQRADKEELRQLRRDIAKRISEPFACLAVALVGAPLGVHARRKGRTSLFSVGLGVLVLYYALVTVAEPTGLRDLSTFIARAWIPNVVLMGIGIVLLWRVDRA
ncbi:MAG: LptF/LptG family permease [Candidatus Hydrogenedentota bacterium]